MLTRAANWSKERLLEVSVDALEEPEESGPFEEEDEPPSKEEDNPPPTELEEESDEVTALDVSERSDDELGKDEKEQDDKIKAAEKNATTLCLFFFLLCIKIKMPLLLL